MSRGARAALAAAVLLAAGLRIRYFTGLQIGDDVVYSAIALDRLDGHLQFTNVQETRPAFLLPVMAAYALFGPGEGPLVLYNVLCSLGLVGAAFFLTRRFFGDRGGAAAALVAAMHPNLVYFATECHTDVPVALWQALSLLALLSADADGSLAKRLLAGLLLGWAYLHKESAVFLVPLLAGHALASRRGAAWYLPVALAALGVFLAETAGYAILHGDPFRRFWLVRRWHSGEYMAASYTTGASILHRLFLDVPVQLFMPYYDGKAHGLVNLAALGLGAGLVLRRAPGSGVLAGWWGTIFFLYCFWPSSFVPFLPGFFPFEWTHPPLTVPLACLLGAAVGRWRPAAAAAALAACGAVCLATAHSSWTFGTQFGAGAREAHRWVERERPARVVSDENTVRGLKFLEGHRPARAYATFHEGEPAAGSVVIVDRFWTEPGRWWSQPVPDFVRRPPASWEKVYESPRLAVYRRNRP
jgi:hypothetical protein